MKSDEHFIKKFIKQIDKINISYLGIGIISDNTLKVKMENSIFY